MNKTLVLKNCKLYNRLNEPSQDILIRNKKIKKIGSFSIPSYSEIFDIKSKIALPGLIDIHIHGAGGSDFGEGTKTALQNMSNSLVKHGITSFIGTTLVDPPNHKNLQLLRKNLDQINTKANILGVHIEGPFINPEKRGGIPENSVYSFSKSNLIEIQNHIGKHLKMMTIAPEINKGHKLITELIDQNVIPSMGHTNANYNETKKSLESGINHVSHLFNAMPSLHHRKPGPILSIVESDQVSAQIISDGIHIHPGMVNFSFKNLGIERCICISDGIAATGLPDGEYEYYNQKYKKHKGAAYYPDGTLIGSATDLMSIMFKFKRYTDCTLQEALATVTKNPARLLGIYGDKGSLAEGKDADIAILDQDNSTYATIVEGKIVYKN